MPNALIDRDLDCCGLPKFIVCRDPTSQFEKQREDNSKLNYSNPSWFLTLWQEIDDISQTVEKLYDRYLESNAHTFPNAKRLD